jgi:hypothetical protein
MPNELGRTTESQPLGALNRLSETGALAAAAVNTAASRLKK